ncbi:uncharacterized protein LOC62_02G002292 [Vanrija pseudolonga]|uniref:Uncharacterized protein n=1 Tax=Vanrija pseudolonga TaxID=143232 RepID=A0AAF0Y1Y7_9TREE|nr:hypothetical protein LOC62_02G002292 [Vanrija pseudolonga]
MLFRTVTLALLASLVAAAPTPEAAPAPDAAPAPETPPTSVFERSELVESEGRPVGQIRRSVSHDGDAQHLQARAEKDLVNKPVPGGVTIRCFRGTDCKDEYDLRSPLLCARNERSSCSFDTWGGFEGTFGITIPKGEKYDGWDGDNWTPYWDEISPVIKSAGRGSQCVNQSGRTKGNSGNVIQKQGRVIYTSSDRR